MHLLQQIIKKHEQKRKVDKNLHCGSIINLKDKNNIKLNGARKFVLEPLTTKQRNYYLRGKYQTFLDGENCQLIQYLSIIDKDVKFFKVPSLNNKIVPYIESAEMAHLFNVDELVAVDVCRFLNDTYMTQKGLTVGQIPEIENELNRV